MRIAPSSLMTSPLIMGFSASDVTRWAYSAGSPRREGKGTCRARKESTFSGRLASRGVENRPAGAEKNGLTDWCLGNTFPNIYMSANVTYDQITSSENGALLLDGEGDMNHFDFFFFQESHLMRITTLKKKQVKKKNRAFILRKTIMELQRCTH